MQTVFKSGGGIAAMAVAAALVAGCGGSANDALPLIRAQLSVKTVSFGGTCETVPIRISPKALSGEANKYANSAMMVTEVATSGPTDENGAPMCNGTGETLPMAPGVWVFSAPLRSDTYKCERDIRADGNLQIIFIDGVEGCSGEIAAPPVAEEVPADGAAPVEGEPPAEGEAPAAN